MVVKIKTGKTLRGALNYNEKKVGKDQATLLLASQFGCDIQELGFTQKLKRFQHLMQLNPKVSTNTMHVVISFPKDETELLTDSIMEQIAVDYIKRIGFGDQPYLVYKHSDTRNPHMHIVTTNIKADGKYISMNNIGKLKSEPVRKAMEIDYGLVIAEKRKNNRDHQMTQFPPIDLEAAQYGEDETKNKISNIVRGVVSSYKYTSFEEFNAILRQFNVVAHKSGNPATNKEGLVYSMVDKYGQKKGIPIKASAIYTSPTLANVRKKYAGNKIKKIGHADRLSKQISQMLHKCKTNREFNDLLKRGKIGCTVTYDNDGQMAGISFIDHKYSKAAFTAEELEFTPQAILNQLTPQHNSPAHTATLIENGNVPAISTHHHTFSGAGILLEQLFGDTNSGQDVSPEFFKKKRKKR